VAVLVVANWGTVCDHVEAWRFQLTRETKTIEPQWQNEAPEPWSTQFYSIFLAQYSGQPVILAVDSTDELLAPRAIREGVKGKPGISLSERSRGQVGVSRLSLLRLFADYWGIPVVHGAQLATGFQWYLVEECLGLTGDAALQDLREYGYRIIEQRLPRRAYVVIHDGELPPWVER
jgi:hypothetical protein